MRFSSIATHRTLTRLCALVPAAVLLAYAGLLSLGRWQRDEFDDFWALRRGAGYLLERLQWSPRPLSETLFYLYGLCVQLLHRPLIASFLGLLWLILLAAALLAFWQCRRQARSGFLLLLPLTLLALTVASRNRWEIFYWPAGAVAYIPTLAGALFLLMQTLAGRLCGRRGQWLTVLVLIAVASSSEAGILLAVAFSLFKLLQAAQARLRRQMLPGAERPLLWLLPIALAVLFLAVIRAHRLHVDEFPGVSDLCLLGHPLASALTGLFALLLEGLGLNLWSDPLRSHSLAALADYAFHHCRIPLLLLLLTGLRLARPLLPQLTPEARNGLRQLGVALLLAAWGTAAAAFLHFGVNCCQRHQHLRESWFLLALVCFGLARWSESEADETAGPPAAKRALWGPVLLALAVLLSVDFSQLAVSYRHAGELSQIADTNYASGLLPGSSEMLVRIPPPVGIVPSVGFAPGTYTLVADRPGPVTADLYWSSVLRFFGKQKLEAVRAQLDGIPAESGAGDGTAPCHTRKGPCGAD